MESGKKTNTYKPTTAEKRVLEVALNPQYVGKSIMDKCKAANVSRDTWYKSMNKPEFIEILNIMTMDLLKGKVADIVNATYNFAINDSKCSSDRKILLTMANLYTDKQNVESTNDTNITIKLEGDLKEWGK